MRSKLCHQLHFIVLLHNESVYHMLLQTGLRVCVSLYQKNALCNSVKQQFSSSGSNIINGSDRALEDCGCQPAGFWELI